MAAPLSYCSKLLIVITEMMSLYGSHEALDVRMETVCVLLTIAVEQAGLCLLTMPIYRATRHEPSYVLARRLAHGVSVLLPAPRVTRKSRSHHPTESSRNFNVMV